MASKKETGIEMEDVLKAAKKFAKAGKLDDLADAWIENRENAEKSNQIVEVLGQVGEFIKANDVEEKLEDFLEDSTKTTKKKSTTKKKTTSTKKKSSTKKTTTKTTAKKKTTTKKTTKK
ncbi:MAG: hypothetical protein IJC38_02650 [Erysipelotrichaceae bacterium]|nr:hypothetical protein [Erysipelotrichaceae bacterium]